MRTVQRLAAIAHLATTDATSDEAARRLLDLLREGLGARDVFLVYGWEGGFRHLGTSEDAGLSTVALWLVQRDLTTRAGPCAFRVRSDRVDDFRAASGPRACASVAAVIPACGDAARMLIAHGRWPRGLSAAREAFLQAALPPLGHFLQRRLDLGRAAREHDQLSALASISRVIAESEDLPTVLTDIAQTTAAVAQVDYVSLDLVDADGRVTLRCVNGWRLDAAQASPWLRAKERPDPVREAVLRTRRPLLFADAQDDQRIPEAGRRFFQRMLIRSAAIFPLVAKGGVLGLLSVASHRPLAFTVSETELLEGLAAQVASAVTGVQLYRSLQESRERLRTVIANAPVVLFAIDRTGTFTLCEGKGLTALGRQPEQVVGRPIREVYAGVPEMIANVERALAGEAFTTAVRVGELVFETYHAPVRDADGQVTGMVGVATDVTERQRADDALRERARRDPLTGALNHAAVSEMLAQLVQEQRAAPLVVALTDVDGLKAVNDTYGHQAGDAVLRAAVAALTRDDAVVGRYGGDEFLSVLVGARREAGERYRDAVRTALAAAHVTDPATGTRVPVVASIGIAAYPDEAETADALVRLADSAMYTAKRARAVEGGAAGHSRQSERVTRMVGEIVPLLTSPGSLDDKLRLVSHRLSVGGGYEVVHFETYIEADTGPVGTNTDGDLPEDLIAAWNRTQRSITRHPLAELLRQTRRPLLLDDPQHDSRLTADQRRLLVAAGIRTALAVPMLWQDDMVGLLAVGSKRPDAFTALDAQFLTAVASQVTAIVRLATFVDDLQASSERLSQAQADTVVLLAAAAEAHDEATGRHLQRVRVLTAALARALGYGEREADELGLAAVLHDIGKIRVPDAVLISPARLSDDEWALMKQHTVWGAEFLAGRAGFELAATVARAHHERWDGSGYPGGLAAEQIPEEATIVTVADALDAMTHDRPYRAGRALEWAVREIEAGAGTQFSPRVVAALLDLYRRGALHDVLDVRPERKAA